MADREEQEFAVGRSHIIERPRLTRLLDEATARVVMLIAPAGYGKTTLARQWLATRRHAWYQGSTASPDVAALALGIAEAAGALIPGVGQRLREWLPTSREPEDEVHVIAALLEDDLASWPDDAWFVIDDYQFLASPAAEDLVQRLFANTNRRLFITSKRRPRWSSARDVLYGNIFEIGQSSMAMSVEEANSVLSSADTDAAKGLVALANGWPAVIGLAALAPASNAVDDDLPETLYEYFAEELFVTLSASTRAALCRLALIPTISHGTARAVVGPTSDQVLQTAASTGMFVAHGAQGQRFHPLLRAFLTEKLLELPTHEIAQAVTKTSRVLIAAEAWNDAFAVIVRFPRADMLDELLARALAPLTAQGRLATIREWLKLGRRNAFASKYLDIADAELAFRRGRYERAETMALAAASALPPADPLRSMAYCRAGLSREFMDDGVGAVKHFKAARDTAVSELDARNALWGQFVVAFELGQPTASKLLEEFASIGTPDHDAIVRRETGTLMLAVRDGELAEAIPRADAMAEVVEEARDPLIRSSFWYSFASAHSLYGEYAVALNAVDRGLQEATTFHLEFARPHTLICRTSASIGLKNHRVAEKTVTDIERWAREMNDVFIGEKARALRCRLYLCQGSPDRALEVVSVNWPPTLSQGLQAELAAMKAAALASSEDPEAALRVVDGAQHLSGWTEPQLLLSWTRAISRLMTDSSDAADQLRSAYARARSTGAIDTFVFAYRLHPGIIAVLADDKSLHVELATILLRADDQHLAQVNHIAVPEKSWSDVPDSLTKRESEVYLLLAEGRSNREIANSLVISEGTAKVHVRNVLKKLGVRNRTHAAIKAAREGPD